MSEQEAEKGAAYDLPRLLKDLNGKSLISLVARAREELDRRRMEGFRFMMQHMSQLEKVSVIVEDRTPPVIEVSVDGLSWDSAADLLKEITTVSQHSGIPISAQLADLGLLEKVDVAIRIRSLLSDTDQIPRGKALTPKEILLELE